jgi:hypothetical protein
VSKWETMCGCIDNQEVGLEAATLERVRNSSLVKCSCADDVTGLKLWIMVFDHSGRRAFPCRLKRRGNPVVEAREVRMPA